jgi:hypothetical protein
MVLFSFVPRLLECVGIIMRLKRAVLLPRDERSWFHSLTLLSIFILEPEPNRRAALWEEPYEVLRWHYLHHIIQLSSS